MPSRSSAAPLTLAAGLAACVLGALTLLGWILGVDELKSIVPGTLTMKPNTAIAFLAIGGALLADGPSVPARGRWIADALAVIALLLGAVVGVQYLLGVDLGIDQLLFREPAGAVGTVNPGRMSPQTTLSFVLLAAALLLARRRAEDRVLIGLVGIPAILGTLNLLDAFLGPATPTLLSGYTQMALPTAVAFIALSAGILGIRPDGGPLAILQGDDDSAVLVRRLFMAALVIPIVIAWLRLAGERAGLYDAAYGVSLTTLATIILLGLAIVGAAGALQRAEARRAASELGRAESEARLEAIVNFAPTLVFLTDLDGRFVLVNRRFADTVGRDVAEIVGRTASDILPPVSMNGFLALDPQAIATGELVEIEASTGADGVARTYLAARYPLRDATGAVYALCGIATDITALKRAEADAHDSRRAAEEANGAKSEFLSRMSHELRTPLNAVLGFAQLLELGDLDADERDSVRYIRLGGQQLLDLINEVLDISRIETGSLSLSPEPVWLPDIIEEQLALIAPLAIDQGIRVEALTTPACAAHVLADRQRLRQVLLNLLSNAVKYNRPDGRIAIGCRDVGEGRIRIEVSDTGVGIPPENLDRLFIPFDRLGAEQTAVEGTGIGLTLARRLVEQMGGTLSVESAVGEGSTFTVELARAEGPVERAVDAVEVPPVGGGRRPLGPEGKTVLHIEDNLSNLRLVEQLVRQRPEVKLITAIQGRLGLELARQHRPDLILLDLNLPDMNGIDVLTALRADPATQAIPVAIVSADATPGQADRLRANGAIAYLAKPLDVTALLAVLDAAPRRAR